MDTIENRLFYIELKIKKLIEENIKLTKENLRLINGNSLQNQKTGNEANNNGVSNDKIKLLKSEIGQYSIELNECIDIVKSMTP